MGGFPEELVFMLIFAVVWLLQFLRGRRRRQAPPAPEDGRDADADFEVEVPAPAPPRPAPRPPAFTPNLAEGPRRAQAQRDPAELGSPALQAARRYSRAALMGDRRAVQDAIVVAAILQPCRARQPYGSE